ncbi:hypothetical protein GCM10020369_50340 [Cryptosporangium minutisporangium]|uniref:DUF3040 domain-containing protein n=1 Tax=Cryptosporangium minutisporangium TaxID=113569 RepID=A0ABP6T4Y8_9ACTN
MGNGGTFDRIERRAANRAWRQLPASVRAEVVRRSNGGEVHPDPEVAAVAERWSRANLERWWNRWPRWLLSLVGVALFVAGYMVGDGLSRTLLSGAGGVITVFGLLGVNRLAMAQIARAADRHRPSH